MRVAAQITIVERVVPHRIAVVAPEPIAPIVARAAELSTPGCGFDQSFIRANPQVATANVDDLAGFQRLDLPVAVAVPTCSQLSKPHPQTVYSMLLISFTKALIQYFSFVGLAGRRPYLRHKKYWEPQWPRFLCARLSLPWEKECHRGTRSTCHSGHRRLIGQHFDSPTGFAERIALALPTDAVGIVAHLDDPTAARPAPSRRRPDRRSMVPRQPTRSSCRDEAWSTWELRPLTLAPESRPVSFPSRTRRARVFEPRQQSDLQRPDRIELAARSRSSSDPPRSHLRAESDARECSRAHHWRTPWSTSDRHRTLPSAEWHNRPRLRHRETQSSDLRQTSRWRLDSWRKVCSFSPASNFFSIWRRDNRLPRSISFALPIARESAVWPAVSRYPSFGSVAVNRWVREVILKQSLHGSGKCFAMILGLLERPTRFWIGIGAAADCDQDNRAWMVLLDDVLRKPGPVARDLVEVAAECCAVAGVVGNDTDQLAVFIFRDQNRHAVIDGAVRFGLQTLTSDRLWSLGDSRQSRRMFVPRTADRVCVDLAPQSRPWTSLSVSSLV